MYEQCDFFIYISFSSSIFFYNRIFNSTTKTKRRLLSLNEKFNSLLIKISISEERTSRFSANALMPEFKKRVK